MQLQAAVAREENESPPSPPTQKGQLKNRVVFGLLIGFGCLGIVLAGGWVFTIAMAAVVWLGTNEYFNLVQSKGMTQGMAAPPPVATQICSAICAAMPLMTMQVPIHCLPPMSNVNLCQ